MPVWLSTRFEATMIDSSWSSETARTGSINRRTCRQGG
jgi:hypothetical protein